MPRTSLVKPLYILRLSLWACLVLFCVLQNSCVKDAEWREFNIGEVEVFQLVDINEHSILADGVLMFNGQEISLINGRYLIIPNLKLGIYKLNGISRRENKSATFIFEVVKAKSELQKFDLETIFINLFKNIDEFRKTEGLDATCVFDANFENAILDSVGDFSNKLSAVKVEELVREFGLFSSDFYYDELQNINGEYRWGNKQSRLIKDVFGIMSDSLNKRLYMAQNVLNVFSTVLDIDEELYPNKRYLLQLASYALLYNFLLLNEHYILYRNIPIQMLQVNKIKSTNNDTVFYNNRFYDLLFEIEYGTADWRANENWMIRRVHELLNQMRLQLIREEILWPAMCQIKLNALLPETVVFDVEFMFQAYNDDAFWGIGSADTVFFQYDRWDVNRFYPVLYRPEFKGEFMMRYYNGFRKFEDTIAPLHFVHHLDNSGYNDFTLVSISDSVLFFDFNEDRKIEVKVGNKYLFGYGAMPISWYLNDTLADFDLTRLSGHSNFDFKLEQGTHKIRAVLGDWRDEKPNLSVVKNVSFEVNIE